MRDDRFLPYWPSVWSKTRTVGWLPQSLSGGNSHHSSWHGLSHSSSSNSKQASVNQVQHSNSDWQHIAAAAAAEKQSGSVQILRVTLLVPLLPCTWGAACQVKQSMCDLRDACSLYGRDQYLTEVMVLCFCKPLSAWVISRLLTEDGDGGCKNIPPLQQPYLPHCALNRVGQSMELYAS